MSSRPFSTFGGFWNSEGIVREPVSSSQSSNVHRFRVHVRVGRAVRRPNYRRYRQASGECQCRQDNGCPSGPAGTPGQPGEDGTPGLSGGRGAPGARGNFPAVATDSRGQCRYRGEIMTSVSVPVLVSCSMFLWSRAYPKLFPV